jgi:predicted rRNA methylase YqxC with S4 and FtsJ domains
MKRAVKPSLSLAKKAIKDGEIAIRAARKAKNAAAVNKNKKVLAKAKKLFASLKQSEKLANSMCVLQVLFSEFAYA